MSAAPGNTAKLGQVQFPSSPQTVTLDIGAAGASRQCGIFIASASNPGITSVTVGIDSMAVISGTAVGSLAFASVWGGAISDAESGSKTVTVSFTNTFCTLSFYCLIVTASDLIQNGVNNSNADSPLSLAMTSAAGDLTATCIANDGGTGTTSDKTRYAQDTTFVNCAADYGDGTVNPTHTWTKTVVDWDHASVAGVNFRAAAGGEAPRSMQHFRRRRQ